jgi:hypothetical protein
MASTVYKIVHTCGTLDLRLVFFANVQSHSTEPKKSAAKKCVVTPDQLVASVLVL